MKKSWATPHTPTRKRAEEAAARALCWRQEDKGGRSLDVAAAGGGGCDRAAEQHGICCGQAPDTWPEAEIRLVHQGRFLVAQARFERGARPHDDKIRTGGASILRVTVLLP